MPATATDGGAPIPDDASGEGGDTNRPVIRPAPAPAEEVVNSNKKKAKTSQQPAENKFPFIGLSKNLNKERGDLYNIKTNGERLTNVSRDELISKYNTFLQTLSGMPCKNKVTTKCTCLKFLEDKPFIIESVSNAILDYYEMTPLQKKHYCVERMRHADMQTRGEHNPWKHGIERNYMLPLSYKYFEQKYFTSEIDSDEDESGDDNSGSNKINKHEPMIGEAFKHCICKHAFHTLHNMGSTVVKTLGKYASGDLSVAQHKNAKKEWSGAKKYASAYESLRDSLNMVAEEYKHLADGDTITLPPYFSKRKHYEHWCRQRGWDIQKLDSKTNQYVAIDEWDVLPGFYKTEEEALANGGDEINVAKVVVSWSGFTRFWNKDFSHLRSQGCGVSETKR